MAAELLFSLGILLVASTLLALVARYFRQPMLLAYIIAGVLIGPAGFGLIQNHSDILALSELGAAFLLFAVGIESDFSKWVQIKGSVLLGSIIQVIGTTAIVMAVTQFAGFDWLVGAYLGLIVAFSSTAIVVKVLSDKKQISTLHGRLIIGFAIVQDLLAVILLPFLAKAGTGTIGGIASSVLSGLIVLFALGYLLNRWILPKLFKQTNSVPELFYLIVVSVAFGFMYLSNTFNLSIVAGAFIGGLALSGLQYSFEALHRVKGIRDFFATIFFVSLGMQAVFSIAQFPWALTLFLFFVVFVLNPIIFFLITLWLGYGARVAFTVGVALFQASEFSFIIASQGLQFGILSPALYASTILVIVVSMALTPYALNQSHEWYAWIERRFKKQANSLNSGHWSRKLAHLHKLPEEKQLKDHLIIFGAGVFGSQIIEAFEGGDDTVIIVDNDPAVIAELLDQGYYASFSNAENEELWHQIRVEKAKLAIISIASPKESAQVCSGLKRYNPRLAVFSRAHTLEEAELLYESGCDFVVLPDVLAGNQVIEIASHYLQKGNLPKGFAMEEFREMLKRKIQR